MSQLRSIVFIPLFALVLPGDAAQRRFQPRACIPAQLAPGATLHFALCSLDTARELRRDASLRLESALRSISWEFGK